MVNALYTEDMAASRILSIRAEQLEADELYHHGILGQKWGIRRYQNEDGSVTPAGAKRYYEGYGLEGKKLSKEQKSKYKSAKKELRKLHRDAVEQKEWSIASKRFVKGNERKYNKLRNKYGEEHEKTARARIVLETSKLMDEVNDKRVKDSAAKYKATTNSYMEKYGEKRIKDLKNFKTTKAGEEYVRGASGIERSFYSKYDKNTKTLKIGRTNTIYV